ncbi:MAG: efflux RND transporter periplasmic adaptor subunit [Bryobacteraceae bacterium]|nr:efflux RND transporter periplasmic adaptor subunit [Bryobacteraceae bacterium]
MRTLALVVSLLGLAGCRQAPPPQAPAPRARLDGVVEIPPDSPKMRQIRVEEVRVERLPADEFTAPAKIEFNPNRISRVVLPAPGRVAQVFVAFGDAVEKGAPLLTLESPEADQAAAEYLRAELTLTAARAELAKAQQDYERVLDLFRGDAIAKKEVLAAETALSQAKAAVAQAETSRQHALARLELLGLKPGEARPRITVRAPLSGKVTEFNVVAGEYRNDTSQPVMTIADLSTVWVAADVPETSIRLVQLDERFEVRLNAFPGEVFFSRVARIADSVDPANRTLKVWAELDNRSGRFRPEMFGTVRHVEAERDVPVVPAGAVVQMEGREAVFVEEAPGRFRVTQVRTGKRAGPKTPVVEGLQPGARVVVDGAMLLRGS